MYVTFLSGKYKMMKKEKKKLFVGIFLGTVMGILALCTLLIVLALFFFLGSPPEVLEGAEEYEEMFTSYAEMHTSMITFPEEIPESAENIDFYFSCQDTWNRPTVEAFLQCTYDEKDYEAEIERLENTQKKYGSVVRTLIQDEEGTFPYPAYIAVEGHHYMYEYALLTGEQQITYIYTEHHNSDNLNKIEKKYLPGNFDTKQHNIGDGEGYSIYLASKDKLGWSYDYSRDPVVEVQQYHSVDIGYNWFCVTTCIDESDREIIKTCAYNYYKDEDDSENGFHKEITYNDLKGYVFETVELNEDSTKVIVTYSAGEHTHTKEFEIPQIEVKGEGSID